jgi:hypothetical protein
MAQLVTKVEMVGSRVVKVYGQFHQAQPQDLGIKIKVALSITGNRCDVMDTWHISLHLFPPYSHPSSGFNAVGSE